MPLPPHLLHTPFHATLPHTPCVSAPDGWGHACPTAQRTALPPAPDLLGHSTHPAGGGEADGLRAGLGHRAGLLRGDGLGLGSHVTRVERVHHDDSVRHVEIIA